MRRWGPLPSPPGRSRGRRRHASPAPPGCPGPPTAAPSPQPSRRAPWAPPSCRPLSRKHLRARGPAPAPAPRVARGGGRREAPVEARPRGAPDAGGRRGAGLMSGRLPKRGAGWGLQAWRAPGSRCVSAEGSPGAHGAAAGPRGRGLVRLGAPADLHVAWAAPGPLRARPRAGAAGGSPEAHVFHSALCLEPAPRRLSPWKQNRGGGGGPSVAGRGPGWGEGRWGLAGCCLGNGNRGAPPPPPGHRACQPASPVSPVGPPRSVRSTPVLSVVPLLFPDFFTPTSLTA